jgi:hypothetical protein
MKFTILTAIVCILAVRAEAQGRVVLDNVQNSCTDPSTAANGLFWLKTSDTTGPILINQDFNAAFYGGSDSSSLSLLASFLLSNGSAAGDNAFGPGKFIDPAGNGYTIPGATTSAFFQVQAWTGTFNSYASALSGGAFASQSPVFLNPVSIPPGTAPGLTGMPAMVMSVPEPSTFLLAELGAFALVPLLRGRLNSH